MLDSLLPWDSEDVEIIVGDNSDNSDTQSLVDARCAEFSGRLRCLKHACNIGIMGNLLRAFEVASGRYVWIVGCGDRFLPNAVNTVKAVLAVRPEDFICFPVNGLKRPPWPPEGTYRDFAKVVADLDMGPLASINFTIYRVECARRYLATAYWSASSLIPQTAIIAAGLANGNALYFHPTPVFERLPRAARRWDPRTFWANLCCIYPCLDDWPKWVAIRNMMLAGFAGWIMRIEEEGHAITWPLLTATVRQYGVRSFPLALSMARAIARRRLRGACGRGGERQGARGVALENRQHG